MRLCCWRRGRRRGDVGGVRKGVPGREEVAVVIVEEIEEVEAVEGLRCCWSYCCRCWDWGCIVRRRASASGREEDAVVVGAEVVVAGRPVRRRETVFIAELPARFEGDCLLTLRRLSVSCRLLLYNGRCLCRVRVRLPEVQKRCRPS